MSKWKAVVKDNTEEGIVSRQLLDARAISGALGTFLSLETPEDGNTVFTVESTTYNPAEYINNVIRDYANEGYDVTLVSLTEIK